MPLDCIFTALRHWFNLQNEWERLMAIGKQIYIIEQTTVHP